MKLSAISIAVLFAAAPAIAGSFNDTQCTRMPSIADDPDPWSIARVSPDSSCAISDGPDPTSQVDADSNAPEPVDQGRVISDDPEPFGGCLMVTNDNPDPFSNVIDDADPILIVCAVGEGPDPIDALQTRLIHVLALASTQ